MTTPCQEVETVSCFSSARPWEVHICTNLVIQKDTKKCYNVRCQIRREVKINWLKPGATHYHAQFRLQDQGRAIKGLVDFSS